MWLQELAKGVFAVFCKWEGQALLIGVGTLEEVHCTWLGSDRVEPFK